MENRIDIKLTEQESKILENIIKIDEYNSIRPYLTSILLDGAIVERDASYIDDFIIDWITDNPNTEIPGPMRFIQAVILGRINGDYVAPPTQVSQSPLVPSVGSPMANIEPVIDMEDLPTYLPKIYDLIEREVRRRVKEEMKNYNVLLKKYEELKKKFEGISQMFSVD